jgi:tripeptide aminopeptidase
MGEDLLLLSSEDAHTPVIEAKARRSSLKSRWVLAAAALVAVAAIVALCLFVIFRLTPAPTYDNLLDRFLAYVQYDTQSEDAYTRVPSTASQLVLGKALAAELKAMRGVEDVDFDETTGIVMATVPASSTYAGQTTVGLIAHMDTSPDAPGAGVTPIVWDYVDGDLTLPNVFNGATTVISADDLAPYQGQQIVTSSGDTLLGADDKAGIAEIITAVAQILASDLPHPRMRIGFTPDEEIGQGTTHFDIEKFGADFAYTLDGGAIGEIEAANFNAEKAVLTFDGVVVHPGSAYDKMINAARAAGDFIAALPPDVSPERTQGLEPFIHPTGVSGDCSQATVNLILRTFDDLADLETLVAAAVLATETTLPGIAIDTQYTLQYTNMAPFIAAAPEVLDFAVQAATNIGVNPLQQAIRGGTDGARLSERGLPAPNIWAGGILFHSVSEFVPVPSMLAAVDWIVEAMKLIHDAN